MRSIVALNPAVDGAAEAEAVRPIHKIRTWHGQSDEALQRSLTVPDRCEF
jgi:hypothetical protein